MLKRENLRKNFLRAKQIADQSLGRAEKTEVLTENLSDIDRRVDIIKNVSTATCKKLRVCMQADGSDMEKRLRKIPMTALSGSMVESSGLLGENLIGQMYQMCGELEAGLGKEILQHELEIEENVLNPLTEVIDVDIPNIMKTRKTLNRLVLDMDSAKNRYQTAMRQSQAPNPASGSRTDSIKEEVEDATMKVEQCRDLLVTEMFTFLSKETEYAKCLLELVQAQARYHRRSLEMLEKVIPELETQLETYPHKRVYGCALETHLNLTEREIACVIEECVCALIDCGLDEEGLFRVAGSNSKVKKLKAAFDAGVADLDEFSKDPHVIAGALKMYLRELPEPLLTYSLYQEWMHAALKNPDERLQALWVSVNKLPKHNYNNLRYLIKFLAKLAEKADVNKMSSSNIAIVMGPNLIWSPADGGPNVLTTGTQSAIVESFISHHDWFFPGDVQFHQSEKPSSSPNLRARLSTSPSFNKHQCTTILLAPSSPGPSPQASKWSPSSSPEGASQINGDHIAEKSGPARVLIPPPPPSVTRHSSLKSARKRSLGNFEPSETSKENYRPKFDLEHERRKFMNSTPVLSKAISFESVQSPIHENGCDEEDAEYRTMPLSASKRNPRLNVPATPPVRFHSDIYDTVFALQSLRSGSGWTDYLSKARTLVEGHVSQTGSMDNVLGSSSSASSSSRDIDFSISGHSGDGLGAVDMTQSMTSAHVPTTAHAPVVKSPSDNSALGASFSSLDGSFELRCSPGVQRRPTKKTAPAPPITRLEKCATIPRTVDPSEAMTLSVTSSDRAQSMPVFSGELDGSATPTPSTPEKVDSPLMIERRSPAPPPPKHHPAPAPPSANPVPAPDRKSVLVRPSRPGPPPPPPPGESGPTSPKDTKPVNEQTKL